MECYRGCSFCTSNTVKVILGQVVPCDHAMATVNQKVPQCNFAMMKQLSHCSLTSATSLHSAKRFLQASGIARVCVFQ